MGYRGGELADLARPLERGIGRYAHRTTEKVGEQLRTRVRRHTPFSKPGAAEIVASYKDSGAWRRARGGRRPGTLHDSWQVGEVTVRSAGSGRTYTVPVFTMDPVAPHVEWNTMPHLIAAKPGKVLTIPTRAGMAYATFVHHPGTTGQHMMATALQEIAVMWRETARREWAFEVRRMWQGRVS